MIEDDDDGEIDYDDPDDLDFVDHSMAERMCDVEFSAKFVNGTWLEDVLPGFDRFGVKDPGVTYILGLILKVGRVDTSRCVFSKMTVTRRRQEMQTNRCLDLALYEFDRFLTVGFDTKRVKLGYFQGNQVKEQIVINVHGVSGPRYLGIVQADNGKGKRAFALYTVVFFISNHILGGVWGG